MPNLYEILGAERSDSTQLITKRYRNLAKQCHPDKHPRDAKAIERFKAITEAFEVLSDEAKRAEYDRTGTVPPRVTDSARKRALGVIGQILHKTMAACLEKGEHPAEMDLLNHILAAVKANIIQAEQNIGKLEKSRAMVADVADRFTGEGDDNPLAAIARAPLAEIDDHLKVQRMELESNKQAHDLVKKAKFDRKRGRGSSMMKFGGWNVHIEIQ